MFHVFNLALVLAVWYCEAFVMQTFESSAEGYEGQEPQGPTLQRILRSSGLTAEQQSVSGPLMRKNFPDPSIIRVGNRWYSFATKTAYHRVNIQVASSPDFLHWSLVRSSNGSQLDALPKLPQWVRNKYPATWAPDVSQLSDGSFIMYFSAAVKRAKDKHCVGVATSPTILGPYRPQPVPLFCNLTAGGAIDAFGFHETVSRGSESFVQHYVVFKVDGNSMGYMGACGRRYLPVMPTPIILQAVRPDGYTLQGLPATLLDNRGVEDDGVVEAPSLLKTSQGGYVLFFSSGCFTSSSYTVSYATAPTISGPYSRHEPLLRSGDFDLKAPGGATVARDGRHMVFHAGMHDLRLMYTALISINGTSVSFSSKY